MLTQRRSSSAVCGYSSLSIMFLSADSAIRMSASGSIHVVHERREVEPGVAVEHQLVVDDLERGARLHLAGRQVVARDPVDLARRRELRAELDVVVVGRSCAAGS